MLGLAISTGLSSGSVPARAETAHPEQWPRAASPESLTDARTEAFITELMEGLSLEEKVGQVIQEALQRGVITARAGLYGNVIRVLAPLVITPEQIDEACDVLEEALAAVFR